MATAVRLVTLVALLAWLAARGVVGTLDVGKELRASSAADLRAAWTASEEERLARTLAGEDRSQGLARGYHLELFHALVEHVAPDGEVRLVRRLGVGEHGKLAALIALVTPRVFRVTKGEDPPSPDRPTWFLDFAGARAAELATTRTAVARGPDWVLWR